MSDSLKAAALAAAKVNAILYAKGKLKLPEPQKQAAHTVMIDRPNDSLITREYDINDVPAPARNLLTRGFVQDEICKYSGASISTRGRYLSYEEKINLNTKDRPLYLHIQGSSKESVNLAMVRIQEMIGQFDKNFKPDPSISPPLSPAPTFSSGGHFVQDKVFVGLESNFPDFSVRDKILGPGGSYLQHIKTESGAQVTLRGRGSAYIEPTSGREAYEPMYIYLTHPKPEGLQTARTLALNLIDTVHTEYSLFQQQGQQAMILNPHLPYQGHVVQADASNSLTPIVTSVVYTCSPNYGFQPTYINNMAEMPLSAHPSSSLPHNPIVSIPVDMNNMPINSINNPTMTLNSVPLDTLSMNSVVTSMPMNSMAPSEFNIVHPVTTMAQMQMNPEVSMAMNSMVPVNPVTSIPLNTMPPVPVSLVTSMVQPVSSVSDSMMTMNPHVPTSMAMNVMTSISSNHHVSAPLTTMPPPHLNPATTMPQGVGGNVTYEARWATSVMDNGLMGATMGLGTPRLPLEQPGMNIMHSTMYRGNIPGSLGQQGMPPTTYTHLYAKQQQPQQLNMPHSHSGLYLQQGQKRKFREERPEADLQHHQDQYRLRWLDRMDRSLSTQDTGYRMDPSDNLTRPPRDMFYPNGSHGPAETGT